MSTGLIVNRKTAVFLPTKQNTYRGDTAGALSFGNVSAGKHALNVEFKIPVQETL